MKFSDNWLRELIAVPVETQVMIEQLTMAGLEVESVTTRQGNFSNIVVARVTAIEPHPGAGRKAVLLFQGHPILSSGSVTLMQNRGSDWRVILRSENALSRG